MSTATAPRPDPHVVKEVAPRLAPKRGIADIDLELVKATELRLLGKARGEDRPASSEINVLLDERTALTTKEAASAEEESG